MDGLLRLGRAGLIAAIAAVVCGPSLLADGMAVPRKLYKGVPYEGSIEERAQEAIIIFQGSPTPGQATEDLILKISLQGDVEDFAWIVPFPNEPQAAKESPALFRQLHQYVEARLRQLSREGSKKSEAGSVPSAADAPTQPVEVLSRKIVGSFDVAVVRENLPGALNGWLEKEGYRTLGDADDLLGFYHRKGYVYACVKVSQAQLERDQPVDLHPLRFTFKTGGRDAMYFPIKMTGLQQQQPFDVNLYVFYKAWINDHVSKFGYEHRGFRRRYRDWDSPDCEPNAGKTYFAPQQDPFLKSLAHYIPAVAELLQRLHPGHRYYLTNIQARGLVPEQVRGWSDDLWLFPYYIDERFVPYDVRPGGPASTAWPNELPAAKGSTLQADPAGGSSAECTAMLAVGVGAGVLAGLAVGLGYARARKAAARGPRPDSASQTTDANQVK